MAAAGVSLGLIWLIWFIMLNIGLSRRSGSWGNGGSWDKIFFRIGKESFWGIYIVFHQSHFVPYYMFPAFGNTFKIHLSVFALYRKMCTKEGFSKVLRTK